MDEEILKKEEKIEENKDVEIDEEEEELGETFDSSSFPRFVLGGYGRLFMIHHDLISMKNCPYLSTFNVAVYLNLFCLCLPIIYFSMEIRLK